MLNQKKKKEQMLGFRLKVEALSVSTIKLSGEP